MIIYKELLTQLREKSIKLAARDKRISILRLLIVLAAGFLFYQFYSTGQYIFLITSSIAAISFILLIRLHQSIRWKHALAKEKITINENELDFIEKGTLAFDDGKEFIQHDHPYSCDLDFFGELSLFQTLNRTATVTGKRKLADSLLHIITPKNILQTQEAIKELTPKLEWRQHFLALGLIKPDTAESSTRLMEWADKKPSNVNRIITVLSFLLPTITIILLGSYFFASNELSGRLGGLFILANLGMLGVHILSIKNELISTTKIEEILKQYSFLLKAIEEHSFQSEKLNSLQSQLTSDQTKASEIIHHLSLLFGRLEHVTNAFGSPVLNGLTQYHIHVLRSLAKWRKNHATKLREWLDVVGEVEKLNSLANFAYNNPEFTFPKINEDQNIRFENLGHPLISKIKSVTNSIDFKEQAFFILTGSNMSGKSTFLRTIGVNMVLAGIGAPVYASKANVHPMPVLVSMRLSDSLSDSESYFYAEVKRLKSIMDQLDQDTCFVLLDEILRGTNSDDKRNGTIEVIRKMADKSAFGGIATHDLEVCKVAEEFPGVLSNKRFEVEIIDDELVFDYKLQDGVCQNKSASFIMKKMGVI